MAYEVMSPKSDGDPVSARDWNRIVENFAQGVPDLMTTKGDLVAATGADAAARVAVGANGTFLFADSGANPGLLFSARPLVHAYCPSGSSGYVAPGSWLKQSSALADLYDTTSSFADSKLTIPVSGYYLISGQHFFYHLTSDGWWSAKTGLYKNGSLACVLHTFYSTGDATQVYILAQGSTILKFEKTDELELYFYITNTGGSVYLIPTYTRLLAVLL